MGFEAEKFIVIIYHPNRAVVYNDKHLIRDSIDVIQGEILLAAHT